MVEMEGALYAKIGHQQIIRRLPGGYLPGIKVGDFMNAPALGHYLTLHICLNRTKANQQTQVCCKGWMVGGQEALLTIGFQFPS